MRTHHTQHTLPGFPVYSAAFIANDKLVLGGGGGSSRSGVKNKLRLYKATSDSQLELLSELELEKDEDAPMSMASDIEGSRIVCGINSSTETLEKGINENCRVFNIASDRLSVATTAGTLRVTPENLEECQKVTAVSPGRILVAAAGSRDLSVLSYPSLVLAAETVHTDHDIYDATFSTKSLIVATTNNLLVYSLPTASHTTNGTGPDPRSRKRRRQHSHKGKAASTGSAAELNRVKVVPLPLPSLSKTQDDTISFRAARFHPQDDGTLYTVVNVTPARTRSRGKAKASQKRGYVLRWNTDTWDVVKTREIGDKGITCFDISSNGNLLAFGTADLSIGILDAQTLAPLLSILKVHDFPPTVIRFNPSSSLLLSGSADNSVRLITIPESLGSSSWTGFIITLIIILIAIIVSLYLNADLLKH